LSGILALRQKIIGLLSEAAAKAQVAGKLPAVTLPEVALEHPQNPEHGDYASSLPLKLARATGLKPLDIANAILEFIPTDPDLAKAVVAPPGFINFTLGSGWLSHQVERVLASADTFGNVDLGKGRRVQIEFVSVNPTGPLHVGHGRGAILGSALANILSAAGFAVETEYYINDAGSQIEAFKRSLYARYQQALGVDAELPADGYFGSYMAYLAQAIKAEDGDKYSRLPEAEAIERLGQVGLKRMIDQIKTDLERLGVAFDVWFSERSLFQKGQYETAMALLKEGGYIADKETATWFVSTALGENKDNVVVRSDGSPTYFATDIAYHYNKFVERKFGQVINIWGADHQGHVSRMKAVVGAMGIDPERLKVIVAQMVTLRRGGELVRISKRSGDIITLNEVVDEVGADVSRFFFLARSADSQMDFDLELAKKESAENPVYYVQYAHARIASILKLAAERKINYADGDVSLLSSEPEQSLIRKMLLLPEVVEMAANSLGPHQLAYYAQELATVFHSFYKQCRVVSRDDARLSKARLKLVVAAKITLSRCLHLMGMTAPDTM
jgi:arginyl-tRNA synthetase